MNLRAIEIFVATIDEDGMSQAAKRLNISQSAVSQAISSLERSLSKALVDRSVRPLKLTLAGSVFYSKATDLLNCVSELKQVVALDSNEMLPFLRIGMVDSFAATAGPFFVQELENIAARLSVGSGMKETSIRALLERRVDFVITSDESHVQSDLVAFPVFEEPYFLVAPKVHPVSDETIGELSANMSLIRFSDNSFIGQQINNYLQQRALAPHHKYELDTSDAVIAMVAAGIGWTISTPLVVLKGNPSPSRLRFHPLCDVPMKRKLWLVARRTENPELAQRIATAATDALTRHCVPRILDLVPWMRECVPYGVEATRGVSLI